MKKLKLIWGNWVKRFKKCGVVKMLTYKSEIKKLNNKIEELEEDKRKLSYELYAAKVDQSELDKSNIKIASLEQIVAASDKSLKQRLEDIKKLDKLNNELLTKSFNLELELKSKEIQIKEYELEIEDLKSDRYLIKKIPTGRTKNTIKTKISKPMSANVTRYMRGEHE